MKIPTIEELVKIAKGAARNASTVEQGEELVAAAIRDAVVAACRPQLRPIAEMPNKVPEGCVRVYWRVNAKPSTLRKTDDTHFTDIALPTDTYPADFERAFAESYIDASSKEAAFKLWKGGAR